MFLVIVINNNIWENIFLEEVIYEMYFEEYVLVRKELSKFRFWNFCI